MITVHASHIEQPLLRFLVTFFRAGYFNVFWHPAETRTVAVLAQTNDGALRIARYHWSSGSDFRIGDA